jgi:hypothetical protein
MKTTSVVQLVNYLGLSSGHISKRTELLELTDAPQP